MKSQGTAENRWNGRNSKRSGHNGGTGNEMEESVEITKDKY